ncbi:MAG TPA: hypothetical protein VKA26_12190 [Ignavibacteriaceae bacterium]|nr:hypothetical protein [Ignavibacteriaceae bacterium]
MKKSIYFLFIILAFSFAFLYQGCGNDDNPVSGGVGSTTVTGTLTIPAAAPGKTVIVIIDSDRDGDNGFLYSATGTVGSGTSGTYTFNNIANGTYYIYAVVFIVGNTNTGPQSGDYLGFYGGTINNPPNSANATVPSSGSVTFNINLQVMT